MIEVNLIRRIQQTIYRKTKLQRTLRSLTWTRRWKSNKMKNQYNLHQNPHLPHQHDEVRE
jgi:hypothetical protein